MRAWTESERCACLPAGPQNPYITDMSPLRAGVQRRHRPAHSSPAEAFKATLDLFATGLDLMRQNLRRSHPGADDQEIERSLQEWLIQRPGAESGDCPGRSLDVNARFR